MKSLNRKDWLKLRKNFIGASDAPVIMNGMHFRKTPYQLWQEKLGLNGGSADNAAMRYGRETEEPARKAYERYTGNLVTPQMVFHPKKKFMMATLDGLTFNGDVAVEIKCPGHKDHSSALDGKVPDKYYAQLQHQLACIGIDHLHYYSYRDGEGVLIEVQKDPGYIARIYEEEGEFWNKVLSFDPPKLTSNDFQNMETMQQWNEITDKWSSVSHQLKLLQSEEKELRKSLIDMSGNINSKGNGVKVTKILRKGCVNYIKIPELQGVDLEKYREKAIETWRIEEQR